MFQAHFLCLLSLPFVFGADNAQLVQTHVNVQQSNIEANNVDKSQPDPESATASIAVQQEVLAVNQDAPSSPPQANGIPLPPQSQQPVPDSQTVQLLKEANAQYQYQINSRYEEKTRPVYGNEPVNSKYAVPVYPYGLLPGYPYYKENSQYQELGNGQRRADTTLLMNDGVKAQIENQDQSSYTHQRSQSYSEYGKGEMSPDYNTYAYKRTYY